MENHSKPVHKYKYIALSDENYQEIKNRGKLGQTYNDVVTDILSEVMKTK